ncbi:MAG: TonB-dependent receptor, partial [Gammaproteobacteria bacterium]|nr:TonB-dependent receptor [Gammaproteobacteria bacterium]
TPATAIIWVGGNEFAYEKAAGQTFRQGEGETDFWLPGLDMDLEVYENLIARLSYSRTLARPTIAKLSPARDFVGNPNVRSRFVSAGNPDLLPFMSDNFDLSLEWYYGDGSYASIGYFKKKVDNFLVSRTVEETFEGLTDPYIGAEAEQARAELEAEGVTPTDQAVHQRINENRGVAITDPIRGLPGDPLAVFDVTTHDNAEVGNLFGWELALQHMFGDTGWGVQANYTIVNGNVNPDRDLFGVQFALGGMSDSGNLSVFYENDLISARIAYNWRDEYFNDFDGDGGPVFVEEYAPIDANVTWFATDQLAVFFEAINITEEVTRSYVRYPEMFLRGNEYGSRFNIGARYDFE